MNQVTFFFSFSIKIRGPCHGDIFSSNFYIYGPFNRKSLISFTISEKPYTDIYQVTGRGSRNFIIGKINTALSFKFELWRGMKILLQPFCRWSFSCSYQLGSRGTERIGGLPIDTSGVRYHDPHFLPHIARQYSKEKQHWLLEQTRNMTPSAACLHQRWWIINPLQDFCNNVPIRDVSAQLLQ